MRGKDQDTGAPDKFLKSAARLFKEAGVPGPDALVHQQDLRRDTGGHREGQAGLHARRIGPHRQREKLAQIREARHLVELLENLGLSQPEIQTAENDILITRTLRSIPRATSK